MSKDKIFTVGRIQDEILTERPEGMSYEEYREKRKEMQKKVKHRVRGGFMVHRGGTLVGPVPEIKIG